MLHTSTALQRPVTTAMTFIALVLVGLISLHLLPLEEFPDVTFPGMQVIIPYPGSTPEEVEQLITRPVEEALSTLAGIEELRSRSEAEQATFQIQFDWGRDIDAAAFDVRTKLDSIRAELPAGADRILAFSFNASDQPVVVVRISADQDLTDQYDALERYLKRPLERVPGVARVELQGVAPREVRILINAGRMAAHSIDVQRLATLLQKSNFSVSAGEITEQGQRFSIRPIGEFRSLDDIRNVRVTSSVRLADIADVELVAPELEIGRHLDNRPAVGLDIFKTTQANVVEVVDAALKEIERAKTLPQLQGVSIIVIGNQAESIRNSLGDLRDAGLIGLVLAIAVLFFFLRDWSMTAIVALAVPGSLLITLAALYFLGLTLNIFSMMGMMLAIGMLVDNAVVITESVFRQRQLTPGDPRGATLRGVSEVGVATLAGTLATIIVFVPLVFGSPSEITILMKHVAVPIVIAMVASLLVAQTIIPMLSVRITAPLAIASGSFVGRLQDRYAAALQWVLGNPRKTGIALLVIIASPVALFATKALKVDPFPQDSGRGLFLDYHIKGTHPLAQVEQAVNRIEAFLIANRERFDIKSVYSRYDTVSAQTLLQLTPKDAARVRAKDVMQWIADEMPEILIGEPSFQFDQQGPGKGFSLQLSGDSTERLYDLSFEVSRQLAAVPGLEGVHSEARSGDEQVHIVVDRDRAAQLNLTSETIAATVAAAMRGDRLRELRTAEREVTMRLLFRASDRQAIEDLASLPISRPDGSTVGLGSIADVPRRAGRPRDRTHQPPDVGRHRRQSHRGQDARRDQEGHRADHEELPAAAGLHVEVRTRRRAERRDGADDADQHRARVRDDLPGHGGPVRIHDPARLDPDLDPVRDRRRVLVPVRDRDAADVHGDDRHPDPDGCRREQRHRAGRAHRAAARRRHGAHRRDHSGGARPAAPDPDDDSHDAAGDAAARDRRCAGRRWQQRRPGVLPDGARDHRRSRLLDDRVAADRAVDVRVVG